MLHSSVTSACPCVGKNARQLLSVQLPAECVTEQCKGLSPGAKFISWSELEPTCFSDLGVLCTFTGIVCSSQSPCVPL